MPWDTEAGRTDEELMYAWLGAYGTAEERDAEEHLADCLNGAYGPEVQASAESMAQGLDRYVEEGHPMGEDLAASLQMGMSDAQVAENAYVTQEIEALEQQLGVEFSDAELERLYVDADANRDQNGVPDVQAAFHSDPDGDALTSLMAAELERLSDHLGRTLTPDEAEELLNSHVPEQARTGEAPFPDWVADHGDRLKARGDTAQGREDIMAAAGHRAIAELEGDDDGSSDEAATTDDLEVERLERMAAAGAAAQGGE